jgi:hypothetical protein
MDSGAADAGTTQPYDVFTSTLSSSSISSAAVGWLGDAGTSAAAPIWAGLIAIADQERVDAGGTALTGYNQTLPALYALPPADFHDITSGTNGDPAGPGYDLATGLGTPVANLLVPALAGYQPPSLNSTQIGVTALPAAPVFGQAVTLDVTVSVVSPGTGVPTGTVTFELGSKSLGTANLTDGDAQLLTTPAAAGTETITIIYSGDTLDQSSSVSFPLTVGKAAATLALGNLGDTYDGSPQAVVVSTTPAGLAGVTVTYTQNGVAVANPTRAGDYAVTATLENPNYTAQAVTGTLVIGQATPTITWVDPGNITVGTPLGAAQLDATASFDGIPVAGVWTYTPSAGTVLPVGNDQILSVSFAPKDDTDFKTVQAQVPINVLQPPPQVLVIGEQPAFQRKLNSHGKPYGKALLTGFTLDFNMPLSAMAASNPGDYVLDTITYQKVKKKLVPVLHPIKGFTVKYTPATDSVTLKLATDRRPAHGPAGRDQRLG